MTADASAQRADKPTDSQGPKMRWPLAAKLTVALLVLVIVPLCVVAQHVSTESQREVARVARENLVAVAHGSAGQIMQMLKAHEQTAARLATEPSVARFLAASEHEREALSPELHQHLRTLADAHTECDAPGLLDVDGIVVASLEDVLLGKDRSFRDYFQASIEGEPYVSGMLVGRGTGRPGVFLTNPVIIPEGEIVGISLIWLKADTIWRIIDQVKVGNAGIAYLVDQDGVIIAHPDRGMLYHSLGALAPDAVETISSTIRFGTMAGSDAPLIPESLGMDELAAKLASDSGSGTFRHHSPVDGRHHVVGYARIEGYPLTVAVDVLESQFLAPMVRLGRVVWLTAILMAASVLLIGSWVVGRMTRPMRRLTRVMVAMEGGRPFEPSDIEGLSSGHDEVAQLSHAFGSMTNAIQQRQERIVHLNAVLRAIRNVNQLITQERNPERLLQGACEALIEIRGYFSAWIARLDEDGGCRGALQAGVGEEAFARLAGGIERGEFPQCMTRALAKPGVVVTEDTVATCGDCPLVVARAGEAGAAARLEHDGRVYGVLAVSVPGHMAASGDERSLFAEVAGDIAFGLYAIEVEAERKEAAEELRQLNMELEQRVADRTAELAAVNKELESFAYSVSHDLRAPLRGMAGFGAALLEDYDDKLDEQGRDYLARMDAAANRMGQLIDDLLTLSRVTRSEMSRETVDLTSLVNEIDAEMREREPDRDVAFAAEPGVTVDGDQPLLGVLLTNLLDNAWKFTGKQSSATIEFGTTEIDGETVCYVRDDGVGFDMAYAHKLFGPFQRLHRVDEFPGTGIGLATVQRITNRHGGRVWAEGDVNKGARIYFTLQRGRARKGEGDV